MPDPESEPAPSEWAQPGIAWAAPDPDLVEATPPEPGAQSPSARSARDNGGVVGADRTIRAAGGVVWTRWGDGRLRILLVHRPKYDDWSLPKGKADSGETDAACALREVREETGLLCSLGDELPGTSYLDRKRRPKTVRYFTMQPLGGAFAPGDEVDEISWLPVDEASRLLSYEHDAAVVAALVARLSAP